MIKKILTRAFNYYLKIHTNKYSWFNAELN